MCLEDKEENLRLTPAQIAKAEVRSEDRRVPMNRTLLFLRFCIVRTNRLVSRVNIALRKKMRKGRVTASDVTDAQKLSNLIDHDEGYKVTNVDRASPAYWENRKKSYLR